MQSLRRAVTMRLPSLGTWPALQQQVAAISAAPKAAKTAAKPVEMGGGSDSKMQNMLRALQPQQIELPPLTPEQAAEAEKRSKEYSRLKMRQHREWQTDLSTKLKLKLDAIAALPPDLQAAAKIPDMTPFPTNREIWTETPPTEEDSTATPAAQERKAGKRSIGTKRR